MFPPLKQVVGGPSTYTMYITALYFCMTCMTSIGFGNVAADTDNEKVSSILSDTMYLIQCIIRKWSSLQKVIFGLKPSSCFSSVLTRLLFQLFCLFLMITSSLLYASIFGHVTTIIHNMTLAAAKYHDMLNNVREFMVLNEVNKDIFEDLFPLIN